MLGLKGAGIALKDSIILVERAGMRPYSVSFVGALDYLNQCVPLNGCAVTALSRWMVSDLFAVLGSVTRGSILDR